MSSSNVVRFVDWYETRNNLWVITEYCPGGALRRVLQDDKRLPESSIRGFMLDIIRGLFHAHAQGVVLGCGICPDGVLLDEFGVSKVRLDEGRKGLLAKRSG
jgi:serine/threonine-protein kinase ULK4